MSFDPNVVYAQQAAQVWPRGEVGQMSASTDMPAGPSTMALLSNAFGNAYEAVARIEKLADGLAGGIPQAVTGNTPVGKAALNPPVASALRDYAASLADMSNRIHSACTRIETAF